MPKITTSATHAFYLYRKLLATYAPYEVVNSHAQVMLDAMTSMMPVSLRDTVQVNPIDLLLPGFEKQDVDTAEQMSAHEALTFVKLLDASDGYFQLSSLLSYAMVNDLLKNVAKAVVNALPDNSLKDFQNQGYPGWFVRSYLRTEKNNVS